MIGDTSLASFHSFISNDPMKTRKLWQTRSQLPREVEFADKRWGPTGTDIPDTPGCQTRGLDTDDHLLMLMLGCL